MELPPELGAQRPATETSKHEKMARWQRVCILREAARAFQLPHGNREHPAVNHAANQRDYILTELPPPVAAAIADEVRPVLRRTRDLYRKRVGNKTELFAAVEASCSSRTAAFASSTLRWKMRMVLLKELPWSPGSIRTVSACSCRTRWTFP